MKKITLTLKYALLGFIVIIGFSANLYKVHADFVYATQVIPYKVGTECSDGIDNADPEDTLVDINDPGCHSDNTTNPATYVPADNNETNEGPSCYDGILNQDEKAIDYGGICAPGVSITASPDPVAKSGDTTVINYKPWNSTSCTGTGGGLTWQGTTKKATWNSAGYNETSDPISATTTFTITCSGPKGVDSNASVTVTVAGGGSKPDLTAGNSTPNIATTTIPVTFSATITNGGTAPTGALGTSFPYFFQIAQLDASSNPILATITDQPSSTMSRLAADETGTATLTYTFPQSSAGKLYGVRVCADKTNSNGGGVVVESDETNNCGTSWAKVDCKYKTYTVTGDSTSSDGTISPTTQQVNAGTNTTLTVTPNQGYTATASGCNGSLSGTTYTTGVINANCTVTATFALPAVGVCAPTHDVCNAGNAINVSPDPGPWTWQCQGATSTASCTEPLPIVNGTCAPTHYKCSTGTLVPGSPLSGTTKWTWDCEGSGGGTSTSGGFCGQNKPKYIEQ